MVAGLRNDVGFKKLIRKYNKKSMLKCNGSFKFLKAKAFFALKATSNSNSNIDLKKYSLIDNKVCRPLSTSDIVEDFPYSITASETTIKANGDIIGTFEIGPLEVGQGVTLGSTLRRAILGALTGNSITRFRINDAKHEFSVIKNVKEDILDIASNLKALRFKAGALKQPVIGYALITGPQIITGGMLRFPQQTVKILNVDQYICTVVNGAAVLEVEISGAAHYERFSDLTDAKNSSALNLVSTTANPMFINLDANFSCVKAVSYKVKLGHDQFGILSDIVEFSITTNGTCSPFRVILEGTKEILELFYPLILSSKIIKEAANSIKNKD